MKLRYNNDQLGLCTSGLDSSSIRPQRSGGSIHGSNALKSNAYHVVSYLGFDFAAFPAFLAKVDYDQCRHTVDVERGSLCRYHCSRAVLTRLVVVSRRDVRMQSSWYLACCTCKILAFALALGLWAVVYTRTVQDMVTSTRTRASLTPNTRSHGQSVRRD